MASNLTTLINEGAKEATGGSYRLHGVYQLKSGWKFSSIRWKFSSIS